MTERRLQLPAESRAGEPSRRSPDDDEAEAAAARERFRSEGLTALAPDAWIAPRLGSSEAVLAVVPAAALDRRHPPADPLVGDLYVTNERIVLRGRIVVEVPLDRIDDAVLLGRRILLVLRDGGGMVLDVDRPQLLRVVIAAARSNRTPGGRSRRAGQVAAR
jgi:hypothetical protein